MITNDNDLNALSELPIIPKKFFIITNLTNSVFQIFDVSSAVTNFRYLFQVIFYCLLENFLNSVNIVFYSAVKFFI